MQGCPRIITNIIGLLLLMIAFTSANAQSDIYLQQLTTIPVPYDSLQIQAYTVVGDYNADGYPDLAVGMGNQQTIMRYEAVNLYFGGPSFDSIPDMVFHGDPNNQELCPSPTYQTSYGDHITALGDFNGDGYDDFAVSASALCHNTLHEGRIYIYYGGPNADTIADLEINGTHDYDYMGTLMASGDFNGDGFSDLISHAGDIYYGERMCIFYGGNPPDTGIDWVQSYSGGGGGTSKLIAGFDPNNDGYDDFSWSVSSSIIPFLFFGGDTLSHERVSLSWVYVFLNFDFSGDGIDDFTRFINGQGYFLCLGGAPFDTIPDFPINWVGSDPFIFQWASHEDKLLIRDGANSRFVMFNTGIPPDTIPIAYLLYSMQGYILATSSPNIGDINANGTGEIALATNRLNFNNYISIYTIPTTGINEDETLPTKSGLLSAYPNPFNSSTTITLTGTTRADITIYDITGRRIATLRTDAGKAIWDASGHPSGVYFARIEEEDISKSIKLVLLK
jgi:hypothetical protein